LNPHTNKTSVLQTPQIETKCTSEEGHRFSICLASSRTSSSLAQAATTIPAAAILTRALSQPPLSTFLPDLQNFVPHYKVLFHKMDVSRNRPARPDIPVGATAQNAYVPLDTETTASNDQTTSLQSLSEALGKLYAETGLFAIIVSPYYRHSWSLLPCSLHTLALEYVHGQPESSMAHDVQGSLQKMGECRN
jgi:hypothetical protein